MIFNKKNKALSLMLIMFSSFIFLLPIFKEQTRVNNLFHASLLFFIVSIIIYRHEIYNELITKKNYRLFKNGIVVISIFLLYFSISGLWNEKPLKVSSEITHSLYIIFFLVIFKITTLRLNRVRVYSILATAIVILCLLTFIFTDKSHIFYSRLNNSFPWAPSNVIDLGGYFAVGILLIFMIIRDTGKQWLYLPVLFLFFGLLLTQSRNPLFSLFISCLPLLLAFKKTHFFRIKIVVPVLFLIGIMAIFMLYNQNILSRITQSYSQSFIRFGIWQEAFNLFLQKPIFGWGVGKELNFTNSIGQQIHTTHSLYFAVLLKGGIVGMITFILMIGYGLRIAVSAFRKGYALECSLFIFSLLFYTNQGMFVIANPDVSWVMFWLPLAIIYSTIDKQQTPHK